MDPKLLLMPSLSPRCNWYEPKRGIVYAHGERDITDESVMTEVDEK